MFFYEYLNTIWFSSPIIKPNTNFVSIINQSSDFNYYPNSIICMLYSCTHRINFTIYIYEWNLYFIIVRSIILRKSLLFLFLHFKYFSFFSFFFNAFLCIIIMRFGSFYNFRIRFIYKRIIEPLINIIIF